MSAPITFETLRSALMPLLVEAGCTPAGDTATRGDLRASFGVSSVYVDELGVGDQAVIEVLNAHVTSVERAVGYLRLAGMLPALPVASPDRIAQAIGDPGSIVGRRIHTSFGDDRDETITRWSTRAVLAVLAADQPPAVQS